MTERISDLEKELKTMRSTVEYYKEANNKILEERQKAENTSRKLWELYLNRLSGVSEFNEYLPEELIKEAETELEAAKLLLKVWEEREE